MKKACYDTWQIFPEFVWVPDHYFLSGWRVTIFGTDHYFYWGGGLLPFLGLADNFFLKNNEFQTIFFITFCNVMLYAFLYMLFEKNTSCACIHMKSLI